MNKRNRNSRLQPGISVGLSIIAVLLAALPARGDPKEHAWRVAPSVRQEPIEWGTDGVFKVPLFMLITSERQWNDTMCDLERSGGLLVTPGPEAPAGVDWKHEDVVLVSLGEMPDFHCTVKIKEVRRIGYRAVCDVGINVLAAPRIQVITAPYYMGRIDRRGDIRSIDTLYDYNEQISGTSPGAGISNSEVLVETADGAPARDVSWGGLKVLFR